MITGHERDVTKATLDAAIDAALKAKYGNYILNSLGYSGVNFFLRNSNTARCSSCPARLT